MDWLKLFVFQWFLLMNYCITLTKSSIEDSSTSSSSSSYSSSSFDQLRNALNAEAGGYVHPDLDLLEPAPCGADRGLGWKANVNVDVDVVVRVPLTFQMTRTLAYTILTNRIPAKVLEVAPLDELDDAALLVLLLVHEVGLGNESKFHAYIQSLPKEPTCGWSSNNRIPNKTWLQFFGISQADVLQAKRYVSRVANGMANDYAEYLSQTHWPDAWKKDPSKALTWSLCQVSSRGTASSTGTRLIPLLDLVNHNHLAGSGFIELTGKEQVAKGDIVDATPSDAGTFIVRSTWKNDGTNRKNRELLVNYNLPDYEPIDWFLSLGFIPPEFQKKTTSKNEL